MKKNTKIILIVVVIVLAWAVVSGTIDIGNLFSTVPSAPVSSSPISGGVGGIVR